MPENPVAEVLQRLHDALERDPAALSIAVDAAARARWAVHAGITALARDHFAAEWVERPSPFTYEGAPPQREPEPLKAIQAAVLTERGARGRAKHFAERARGDGHTWDTIGEALGIPESGPDEHQTRADRAFELVGSGRWPSTARWTCSTCGQRVTDPGPEDDLTEEEGHGPGCTRHARDVAVQRATCDDE